MTRPTRIYGQFAVRHFVDEDGLTWVQSRDTAEEWTACVPLTEWRRIVRRHGAEDAAHIVTYNLDPYGP